MTDRNLTTTRAQVFGDVTPGTECRICGRSVDDGRSKTCSDYCDRIQTAVMGMLNWSSVRRRILDRDDHTCQQCGYDRSREDAARAHVRGIIEERVGDRPSGPSALEVGRGDAEDFDWDEHYARVDEWEEHREELKDRYGDPWDQWGKTMEVDHITPIAEGGHPFDPGNLQTLCEDCHKAKTAAENSGPRTPTREDINESLFQYVSDGGD